MMNAFGADRVSYNSIQLDNLKIFYREAGPKDGPVILLLHGVPTSSRMYQPMLESSLATKYRLIAPDFPGFGHSSWPSRKEFSVHLRQSCTRDSGFCRRIEVTSLYALPPRLRRSGGNAHGRCRTRKSRSYHHPKCSFS